MFRGLDKKPPRSPAARAATPASGPTTPQNETPPRKTTLPLSPSGLPRTFSTPAGSGDEADAMAVRSGSSFVTKEFHKGKVQIDFNGMTHLKSGGQAHIFVTDAYYRNTSKRRKKAISMPKFVRYRVALKQIKSSDSTPSDNNEFWALQELAEQLESTTRYNIIQLIGVAKHKGKTYAVIPYCEACLHHKIPNYHQLLVTDPLAHTTATLSLALNMLNALEYMHKNRLIHGDVKPDNILLRIEAGCWVLADIESSRKMGEIADPPQVITHLYAHPKVIMNMDMPPEPFKDIYSLGITLLHVADNEAFRHSEELRAKHNVMTYPQHVKKSYEAWELAGSPAVSLPELAPHPTDTPKHIQRDMMSAIQAMINFDPTKIPAITQLKVYFTHLLQRVQTLDPKDTLEDRLASFTSSMLLTPASARQIRDSDDDSLANRVTTATPPPAAGGAARSPGLFGDSDSDSDGDDACLNASRRLFRSPPGSPP